MIATSTSLGGLAVLVIVLALPGTIAAAWLAGRMLGVRRSVPLTLLSGLLGWAAGSGISLAVAAQKSDPKSGFVRNVILFSVFGAMSASVWIELLARPGAFARAQQGLTTIPRPIRSTRRRLERVRRYAQITRIAARYGLGSQLGIDEDNAEHSARRAPIGRRLRLALEECGGMFVKMGQALSTRPDLISAPVADELSQLQDHVRPAPRDEVEALLEEELGAPADEVFASFDWEPVAAASIGQAYRAALPGGEPVIVKVQRPGIAASIERDLDVLDQLAGAVETRTTWGADYQVRDLTKEFGERLREELDFRSEARNATELALTLPDRSTVRIPTVYHELTTPHVLVMEWLDGVSVRDYVRGNGARSDATGLADGLLSTMLSQMLVDGRYHADPHPGNVMVLQDGELGLIDFGATGIIDPLQQEAVRDVMLAVGAHDPELMRQAMVQVATLRRPVDDDELERALARFMAKHLTSGAAPTPAMFTDLLQLLFTYGIVVPSELSTFFRALLILDGTLTTLAPGYNTIDAAERLAREWMGSRVTPQNIDAALRQELTRLLPTLRRMPRQVDRLFSTAQRDGLRLRVSLFSGERDTWQVTRWVNRLALAFTGGAVGLISVILIGIKGGPAFDGETSLFEFFGYFGLFCSTVLIMRVLVAVLRDGVN